MYSARLMLTVAVAGALAFGATACGGDEGNGAGTNLSGTITIDGSSTVFPFAQAAAEQFQAENKDVRVTVGESGTGGGFEKFCAGELDISNASRPIKADEEAPVCKKNGVAYAELHIANDGIAVVTNPELKIDCLTTGQLKSLWNSKSKVNSYNQLDAKLPNKKVNLFGPGTDSGTFDFFTEEINGEGGDTRKDYQPSEDDNVLVQGVAGDSGGLGYFGFSYYEANQDKLNLVGVNGGGGCVKPSAETIQNGTYKPLARPIYMYPSKKAAARPEVKAFLEFILENQAEIAEIAKIVSLTDAQLQDARTALGKLEGGTT